MSLLATTKTTIPTTPAISIYQQQQQEQQQQPRLKCGEVFVWDCVGELFAIECLLCDERPLCTLSEFSEHMEVWHYDWTAEAHASLPDATTIITTNRIAAGAETKSGYGNSPQMYWSPDAAPSFSASQECCAEDSLLSADDNSVDSNELTDFDGDDDVNYDFESEAPKTVGELEWEIEAGLEEESVTEQQMVADMLTMVSTTTSPQSTASTSTPPLSFQPNQLHTALSCCSAAEPYVITTATATSTSASTSTANELLQFDVAHNNHNNDDEDDNSLDSQNSHDFSANIINNVLLASAAAQHADEDLLAAATATGAAVMTAKCEQANANNLIAQKQVDNSTLQNLKTSKLIEIYAKFPELWHKQHLEPENAEIQAKCYRSISLELNHYGIILKPQAIKRCLDALRKRYRLEKLQELKQQLAGGGHGRYQSTFEYYEQMEFLKEHIEPQLCLLCKRICKDAAECCGGGRGLIIIGAEAQELANFSSCELTAAEVVAMEGMAEPYAVAMDVDAPSDEQVVRGSSSGITDGMADIDREGQYNTDIAEATMADNGLQLQTEEMVETAASQLQAEEIEQASEMHCQPEQMEKATESQSPCQLAEISMISPEPSDKLARITNELNLEDSNEPDELNNSASVVAIPTSVGLVTYSYQSEFEAAVAAGIAPQGILLQYDNNTMEAEQQSLRLEEPLRQCNEMGEVQVYQGIAAQQVQEVLMQYNAAEGTTATISTPQYDADAPVADNQRPPLSERPTKKNKIEILEVIELQPAADLRTAMELRKRAECQRDTEVAQVSTCTTESSGQVELKMKDEGLSEQLKNVVVEGNAVVAEGNAVVAEGNAVVAEEYASSNGDSGISRDVYDEPCDPADQPCEPDAPDEPDESSTDTHSKKAVTFSRLTTEQARQLIAIFENYPLLWDPRHGDFSVRVRRRKAWQEITKKFNEKSKMHYTWTTVHRKMHDYMKYYRRERQRIEAEGGRTRWYFYENFTFLDRVLAEQSGDAHKLLLSKLQNQRIIEEYAKHPQLWNTSHAEFKRRNLRQGIFKKISDELRSAHCIAITPLKLKQRLVEFRCTYRMEKERHYTALQKGESYQPCYDYYELLNFLEPHIAPFVCQQCGALHKRHTELQRHMQKEHNQKANKRKLVTPTAIVAATAEEAAAKAEEAAATASSEHSAQAQSPHSVQSPESTQSQSSPPTQQLTARQTRAASAAKKAAALQNVCHICGMSFSLRRNLVGHIKRHNTQPPHACATCPKRFHDTATLRIHERSHTKSRPFICEQCGACYASSSKLNQHLKRHGNQRDHACKVCGKLFYSAFECERHTRTHLNIREKVCQICGKDFGVGSSYYAHMLLHSGEKRYKCKICSAEFAQFAGLYKHRKRYHPADFAAERAKKASTMRGGKGDGKAVVDKLEKEETK